MVNRRIDGGGGFKLKVLAQGTTKEEYVPVF